MVSAGPAASAGNAAAPSERMETMIFVFILIRCLRHIAEGLDGVAKKKLPQTGDVFASRVRSGSSLNQPSLRRNSAHAAATSSAFKIADTTQMRFAPAAKTS